jgi:hypothetical protein
LQEQRQSFRRDLRVGQNIFDASQFGFWQEKRVRLPIEQAFVQHFLRMNARGEDPNCRIGKWTALGRTAVTGIRYYGRQERLRRLYHVRKFYGRVSDLYRGEFARDWVACGDPLQQLR